MEILMRTLTIVQLVAILAFTLVCMAQNPSQETRDALQDLRLASVEASVKDSVARMDALTATVSELTASMNRFTGIGIGMGALLGVLQSVQVVLQVQNKHSSNNK